LSRLDNGGHRFSERMIVLVQKSGILRRIVKSQ
jgi:hypothetical protein